MRVAILASNRPVPDSQLNSSISKVSATQRGAAWPINTARPPVISAAAAISEPTAVMKMASWRLWDDKAGSVQAEIAGGVSAEPTRMARPTAETGGTITRQARR